MHGSTSIYVLIDPRTHEIRYVGKTVKALRSRLSAHTTAAKNPRTYRDRWHNQLLRLGYAPTIHLVQSITTGAWAEAEQYWIQYYRSIGCPLTNLTDGGDGAPGRSVTPETKAKMSAAATGRSPSPETLIKLSESHRGKVQPPEVVEKRIAPLRGRKRPPEVGARISASKMGHEVTPETRAKISAAHTGRPNPHSGHVPSEAARANASAALKGRPWSLARRAAEDERQQRKAQSKENH